MAELLSLTSLYILLGVLAAVAIICVVFWAVRRAAGRRGVDGAKGGGGGDRKQEGLLNKDVVGGKTPEPSKGEVQPCPICKARLDGGRCRRLRPCGHVYHAECIDLWLQRKWICPVCRAGVQMSRTEIIDAMV
ncbi:hypothetical protein ACP70R_036536 [Stipagrostis hirtigluma subsp. patula]